MWHENKHVKYHLRFWHRGYTHVCGRRCRVWICAALSHLCLIYATSYVQCCRVKEPQKNILRDIGLLSSPNVGTLSMSAATPHRLCVVCLRLSITDINRHICGCAATYIYAATPHYTHTRLCRNMQILIRVEFPYPCLQMIMKLPTLYRNLHSSRCVWRWPYRTHCIYYGWPALESHWKMTSAHQLRQLHYNHPKHLPWSLKWYRANVHASLIADHDGESLPEIM